MKKNEPTGQSNLLINEPPLSVLPSLATTVGLNEAIVLQQLHYWLQNPKTGVLREDGLKWIFNSYEEWQQNFPFWSPRTVQRVFLDLERAGLVISAQLDKSAYDRRKYYQLNYDKLRMIERAKLAPSNTPKLAHSLIGTTETTHRNNDEDADSRISNVLHEFQANIAPLTPLITKRLKDAIRVYSAKWVLDAIILTAEHNKHNWKYCEAILQNRRKGIKHADRASHPKGAKQPKSKSHSPEYSTADLAAAEAINKSL